jgi:hypothetical protein
MALDIMKKFSPMTLLFFTSCTALGIRSDDTVAQAEQTLMKDADQALSNEISKPEKHKKSQKKHFTQTPDNHVSQ